MASVSFTRPGHVKRYLRLLLTGAALLFLAADFLLFGPLATEEDVIEFIHGDINRIQLDLNRFVSDILDDVRSRGESFIQNAVCDIRYPNEVFFRRSQGILREYCGEAAFWTVCEGEVGSWSFHEHRGDLYFLLRLGENEYYSRFLWRLYEPAHPLFDFSIKGLSVRLKLVKGLQLQGPLVQGDERNLAFSFPLFVDGTQALQVQISLSRAVIGEGLNVRADSTMMWAILLAMIAVFLLRWSKTSPQLFFGQELVEEWILLMAVAGFLSIFFTVTVPVPWFWGRSLQFNLLYLLAVLSGLIRSLFFLGKGDGLRARGWSVLAALLFVLSLNGFRSIVASTTFPSDLFSLQTDFLLLLVCGAAMLAIPLYLSQFDRLLDGVRNRMIFLLLMPGFLFLFFRNDPINLWLPVLLILGGNLIFKSRIRWFFINIPLIAVILHMTILAEGQREKREYIEDNLSDIFINQGNYAKSIAREMVHEINSALPDLRILFYPDENQIDLAMLWEQSLAAKENIPSGIFVCDSRNQVIKHVAHLIPYLDLNLTEGELFPFWAISQTTSSLYGRPTSVAYAAIRVYDGGQLLGTIYIQVLNISTLLHRESTTKQIFALNSRISEHEIGFFRVDERGKLVENPFHVSFLQEEIEKAVRAEWVMLETENADLICYRFPYGDEETVYLFFNSTPFIKISAEWIKLILILGVFFLFLLGFNPLKQLILKYYRTFSFKVLLFLLFLTLGSALVLALNAFNYYQSAGNMNRERFWYEQGRVAQNMTINSLESSGGIDTETLILLGQLLNGEISVYQDGALVDASNYRRIVAGEIPVLMNSVFAKMLVSGAEGVVVDRNSLRPRVYYRVNNLIYMLELGGQWRLSLNVQDNYTDYLINILFLITLIGSGVVLFVRNHIVSPITVLNNAMSEVEKGNLVKLPDTPRELEIKQLFNGFNSMVSGVAEQQRSVSDLARMRTLVKMGRRVAHEVKNPLTPIKLSAEQIQRALMDQQPGYEELIRRAVQFIIEETEHLKRVSYGFLDLSKMDTLEHQEFDIMELLRQEIFAFTQIAPQVQFSLNGEGNGVIVCMDRLKIKQVFKNLIQNAVDAVGDRSGRIVIGVEKKHPQDQWVLLRVQDDGPGMSDALQEQLFEENVTLKDNGFGIGLFVVKRIVELHGGHIWVESSPGRGTTIWMELPQSC